MNPALSALHPYPFERLNALKAASPAPPAELAHISLSIGEPKHPPPEFIVQALQQSLQTGLGVYPSTRGRDDLREAAAAWLTRRYALPAGLLDPARMVLPVTGTREALFAFAQLVVDARENPLVVLPNPFYQIYEGAALLAGAIPWYLDCTARNGFLPDFDAVPAEVWRRCQLLYLCSPGNPAGAVLRREHWARALELADRYDFVIAADECYSEIYPYEDDPPPGLLQVCVELGRTDFRRAVVFHSLSKRSSLPGLRSGLVAGDARILASFLHYRTYHGCAMSEPNQHASRLAWNDEAHVRDNRELYREKFAAVMPILAPWLAMPEPQGGFYLWPAVPDDDAAVAASLWSECHLTVLPGSFLARDTAAGNPGRGRLRLSLVAEPERCVEAAWRIADWCERHGVRTAV